MYVSETHTGQRKVQCNINSVYAITYWALHNNILDLKIAIELAARLSIETGVLTAFGLQYKAY